MAGMTVEPQMGAGFERVWAALMEWRAAGKGTDRRIQETERLAKEAARRRMYS
ncbi:MAG: hypothetical protein LBD58_11775 [Treponema sp.]|nr:hypothetical protein [Treponema sp.]